MLDIIYVTKNYLSQRLQSSDVVRIDCVVYAAMIDKLDIFLAHFNRSHFCNGFFNAK